MGIAQYDPKALGRPAWNAGRKVGPATQPLSADMHRHSNSGSGDTFFEEFLGRAERATGG